MGNTIRGISAFVPTTLTPGADDLKLSGETVTRLTDSFESYQPSKLPVLTPPVLNGTVSGTAGLQPPADLKIDVSALKPGTAQTVEQVMGLDPGQLQTLLSSDVFRPEVKTRAAMVISELELSSSIPPAFVDQVVQSGQDLADAVDKLGISSETMAKLGQHFETTPEQLEADWAGFDETKKAEVLSAMFKLEHPPSVPIATIEELAKSNASLDTVKSALGLSDASVTLIRQLEGQTLPEWTELDETKRMDLMAKMFRHENLIPAYDDAGSDQRLAKLKSLIDADHNKPSFLSNLGDFALASVVNIVSDYVFFNAAKWKDPSQHGGEAVSMAYRVYQVALQAYSSVWLGANHGTGTSMAFWWNQWNAVNDFGYYGVATIADKLGLKPQGWDGADWPQAVFNDANPPNWFSWTQWALTHPGEPTTGGNILSGALGSVPTTLELLSPSANTPWRSSSGDDFFSKVGSWLSKLVPGRVF